ncbi:TrkH family potassium uptake protein [Bacteriovorax sp. DB6_IX]|uniref:TrkH family potassium uptake protein n=1 Tax=Bacteriovorax sp. DB6_IX TaxID=1353530 RepID=UPI00038A1AA7|nr:potassium transporter TrkG [Bacteriovorax sp. DB6_IX]EQC52468.1 cation transport protein [Bacteriovorax sp. DB6_IX]
MAKILHKLSFLLELFFNGSFILIYSLYTNGKIPATWNEKFIGNTLDLIVWLVPAIIGLSVISNIFESKNPEDYLRKYSFSLLVFIPTLITWGDMEFTFLLAAAHLLSTVLSLYDEDAIPKKKDEVEESKFASLLKHIRLSSAQLVLLSFLGVILLGTFILMLPVSAAEGKTIGFVDALFTATSATCVTGLSTLSLNEYFSVFGQVVVLVLIQIGGLSIMTLYSSMAILLGRSMRMKDRIIMQDLLDVSSLEELFAMIINIVKYTFIIELWGGVVLTIAFTFEGFEFGKALYYGFFHSISAFCNAGFALFNNSLENYATNPLIHGTISVLIILGGIGFIALKELKELISREKTIVRLGMHTKIVLITTAVLIVGGSIFIFFGEFLGALDGYTLWEKIQISTFQSVTLRTAGFNTIPLTSLNKYTLYLMTMFMFIGGSPGSTAGGVKTTTLAILVQSIMSTLKGDKNVRMLDRTIPSPLVVRATALMFISILITSFFIFLMMKLEPDQDFLTLFFEAISASGTVGLTLGVTPYLSMFGKLAISALMLVGRIGPLTLILAIGERQKSSGKFDYPDGRIMIG